MQPEALKPESNGNDIKKVKYDCKQYEMNMDGDAYKLQIEIFEDNKILFKLRKLHCISYTFFLKEFKYKKILEALDLEENDYNNSEELLKILDTLIKRNDVKLYKNEDYIVIVLTVEKNRIKTEKSIYLEEEIKYKTYLYKTIEEIIKMRKNGATSLEIINRLNEINDDNELKRLKQLLDSRIGEPNKIENNINALKKIKEKKKDYIKIENNKNIKEKKTNEINLIFYNESQHQSNLKIYSQHFGNNKFTENIDIFINGIKNSFDSRMLEINNNEIELPYEGFYYVTLVFKDKIINCSNMFNNDDFIYIDLSSFETQDVTSMQSMFYGCRNLIHMYSSPINTQNVTNMENMFSGCYNLVSIDFSSLNTQNVTNMQNMFYGCQKLVNINLSAINTQNVTNMENMFYDCNNLVNIDLSSLNTQNVTNMKNMFYNCSSLVNIDVSSFNTQKVVSMEKMFYNCTNLINADLSSFNTQNLVNMGQMFYNCKSLINANLSSFNTKKVYNMESMFYSCKNLVYVDLSNFSFNNTNIKNLFRFCINLNKVKINKLLEAEFEKIINKEIIELTFNE